MLNQFIRFFVLNDCHFLGYKARVGSKVSGCLSLHTPLMVNENNYIDSPLTVFMRLTIECAHTSLIITDRMQHCFVSM